MSHHDALLAGAPEKPVLDQIGEEERRRARPEDEGDLGGRHEQRALDGVARDRRRLEDDLHVADLRVLVEDRAVEEVPRAADRSAVAHDRLEDGRRLDLASHHPHDELRSSRAASLDRAREPLVELGELAVREPLEAEGLAPDPELDRLGRLRQTRTLRPRSSIR